jgi:hypothetical protein
LGPTTRSSPEAADDFVTAPVTAKWRQENVLVSGNARTRAFDLALLARVLARAQTDPLHLSRLRVAINGAEPIDHRDMTGPTRDHRA